jgi:hypothetical protein
VLEAQAQLAPCLPFYLIVSVDVVLRVIPATVALNVSVHVPWITLLFALKATVELTGAAPKLIEDGVIRHVVLVGLPEQPSPTVPVRFALGVTVIVNCAWCPEEMVCPPCNSLISAWLDFPPYQSRSP